MSSVDIEHPGQIPQKRAPEDDASDESQDDGKRRPGRKPITTEASSKRTAQNRAAQRAFRERKQQYLKSLEDKIQELTERQERTERENKKLKSCVDRLRQENVTLKNGSTAFTYEEQPPADFEAALGELFDPQNTASPALDLTSSFELQQAAMKGADLTKPGALDAIQPAQTTHASSGNSPQSVPVLYPGLDLSSATTGAFSGSLLSQSQSQQTQSSRRTSALAGQDALLNSTSTGLTGAFSNDILNGIQLLASNQNISSGSFLSNLFDSPTASSSSAVPVSPTGQLAAFGGNNSAANTNASVAAAIAAAANGGASGISSTGDMYVPLSNLGGGATAPGFFGMDSLQGPNGFANLASLMQQGNSPMGTQSAQTTPSLSELFSLSPNQFATDGLINYIPSSVSATSTAASGIAPASLVQDNSTAAKYQPAHLATVSAALSSVSVAPPAIASDVSSILPAHLMAYRNPDPVVSAEDGDQLEKLLLSSMNTLRPASSIESSAELDRLVADISAGSSSVLLSALSSSSQAGILTQSPVSLAPPQSMALTSSAAAGGSSASDSSDHTLGGGSSYGLYTEPQCTCRTCDQPPCAPCPKHGSPEDISEELRDMAPQVLEYVCSENNVMADEELNDLCSLMYKHARCSEVQKRVEMVREKLKSDSTEEMLKAKRDLVKQLNLH
ncbi:DNA-binding transcription factor yap1 [Coemansia sp. Benny D115]|nr:DNA-binding transcription factor yap1 [Coemansia sp. Benny D115]